ncbi:uncharacterized protein LOC108743817 [Agrilus planipennis]|uniref:Male-enhanced antigen 1 n=1 Tax=Agrilus planipennis TaxID=224129 RepID=A0A1W4XR82_AGRPL|nr:uncharacterized protein LOC108743817 [Agrilus planipennis]
MGLHENGLPDPPEDLNKSLSVNENIFIGEDSGESEDDDQLVTNVLHDYQPLPLGPDDVNDNSCEEEEENDNPQTNVNSPFEQIIGNQILPTTSTAESDVIRAVWSEPPKGDAGIDLDSNKIDEVKRAMLNITLPQSAIPEWAKTVPEDQWKEHLLNKIQNNDRH